MKSNKSKKSNTSRREKLMFRAWVGLLALGILASSACTTKRSQATDGGLPPGGDAAAGDGLHTGDGPPPGDGVRPGDGPGPLPDGVEPPTDGPLADSGKPATSYKVAAVQYTEGQAAAVKASCTSDPLPDVCATSEMIKQARLKGALFAVTPEYALGQKYYEPTPKVGENPATSSAWTSDMIIKRFSLLAKQQKMYITIDLLTYTGQKPSSKYFNTAVSFDPTGTVVDVHHKFNLYSNEGKKLTEGTDVSVFNTPLGKVGVVICADIQGSADEGLRKKLAYTLKARLVMLPAMWYPNPGIPFFKSFAKKYGFYVAAANTTAPTGNGGGIFSPAGAILDQTTSTSPATVIASIPKPGTPPPPPPPAGAKVVITEMMINPSAVSDSVGEWIELYNADTKSVDLKGWTIADASGSHTVGKSVTLAPGQYKVLAAEANPAKNGGVTPAYAYSGVTLNNSGDTVSLYDSKTGLADEVKYLAGWSIPTGAALSLKKPGLDNGVVTSWCKETSAWSGSAGDKGTPGAQAKCK